MDLTVPFIGTCLQEFNDLFPGIGFILELVQRSVLGWVIDWHQWLFSCSLSLNHTRLKALRILPEHSSALLHVQPFWVLPLVSKFQPISLLPFSLLVSFKLQFMNSFEIDFPCTIKILTCPPMFLPSSNENYLLLQDWSLVHLHLSELGTYFDWTVNS